MCDDELLQRTADASLSRRTFGALAMGAGVAAASGAYAASLVEKDIVVTTPDGQADAALIYPEGKGAWPAVLVWTDIMGLRPVFRELGKRLAAEGYVVLVPNPFYRDGKATEVGGKYDFSTPEGRAGLMGMRAKIDGAKDGAAYVAFLDAQPQTDRTKKAGVQGYCMGGPLTPQTAAAVPDRIAAGASFHGGGLATDKPDSPHLLVPKMKGAYLIAVAKNDDAKNPAEKEAVKAAFAAAGIPATVEVYGGDHGWCVPASPAYNQTEAERAWAELLKLYKKQLA